jgi:uncharacterized protein (DUF2336 family)
MMKPSEAAESLTSSPFATRSVYSRLRDTALTGNTAFFHTALADSLGIDFAVVSRMVGTSSYTSLLAALRALDLTDEQAFMITAAAHSSEFSRPEAIRLFLSRYRLLHRTVALDRLEAWKAGAATIDEDAAPPDPQPWLGTIPGLEPAFETWIMASESK